MNGININGLAEEVTPCVVSLFDFTGIMAQPWAEAGFVCHCVDVKHPEGERRDGNIVYIGCDVADYLPPRGPVAAVFAFPPCTDLAVSGARWFAGKGLGRLSDAIRLFHRATLLCEWAEAPYLIENPVSVISSHWRKPDYTFNPWQYGDTWTKRTCLWTGGGFRMPEPLLNEPPPGTTQKIWNMAPSPDRAARRSETPPGFARAVFVANAGPWLSGGRAMRVRQQLGNADYDK